MADIIKKVVIRISCSGQDIPLKYIKRRVAIAKRIHPNAEIAIRIVNR